MRLYKNNEFRINRVYRKEKIELMQMIDCRKVRIMRNIY